MESEPESRFFYSFQTLIGALFGLGLGVSKYREHG